MKTTITADDAKALKDLYAQLPSAIWLARNAMRTEPGTQQIESDSLARFLDADSRVSSIIEEIRSIVRR